MHLFLFVDLKVGAYVHGYIQGHIYTMEYYLLIEMYNQGCMYKVKLFNR